MRLKFINKNLIIVLLLIQAYSNAQITRAWIAQYNGTANQYDEPTGVICRTNCIYVAGYTGMIETTSGDFLILKYNLSGNLIWRATYNGPASHFDGIKDFFVDDEENIYVTGISRSSSTTGTEDYYTIKYDSSGNALWGSRYNDIRDMRDIPVKIIKGLDGNIIVVGHSSQPFGAQNTTDILTIKYNSLTGDTIWNAIFNNNGLYSNEDPSAVTIDNIGNIYITGKSSGSISYDIITLKYNSAGNLIWSKRYDGISQNDDYGSDIKIDNFGNVYVLGSTKSQLPENFDYILIKYNTNGDTIWTRKYNGIGNHRDFGRSLVIDESGIYLTGESSSGGQNTDIVTLKYDFSGNLMWSHSFDGNVHMADSPARIVKDPYGYYFVVGSSARGVLNWDYVVLRLDQAGNQIWYDTFNSSSNDDDNGVDISFGLQNDMYFTGTSFISGQLQDIITIKYDNVIGINHMTTEIPRDFSLSQNYPNPFNPSTHIKFQIPKSEFVKLIIFDVLGKEIQTLVNQQLSPGIYSVDFEGNSLPSGVYYYRVESGSFSETKKMVLIK